MTKLTGNWYTDPMGEFYSWQDYERLYAEQEQCNVQKNQNKIQIITEEECSKCEHLNVLTDVDDKYIYRCALAIEFRTSSLKNLIIQIHENCKKCR